MRKGIGLDFFLRKKNYFYYSTVGWKNQFTHELCENSCLDFETTLELSFSWNQYKEWFNWQNLLKLGTGWREVGIREGGPEPLLQNSFCAVKVWGYMEKNFSSGKKPKFVAATLTNKMGWIIVKNAEKRCIVTNRDSLGLGWGDFPPSKKINFSTVLSRVVRYMLCKRICRLPDK